MYIDTHAHFDICFEENSLTKTNFISDLSNNEIKYAVQVSIEVEGFDWSYSFAKENRNIFFTLGIHPSSKATDDNLKILSDYVHKVIGNNDRGILFGIGECGLDYYRMRQPKNIQKNSFEYQLDVAEKNNLPVIIHSRDAEKDTLEILRNKKPGIGIMHCFSGDSKSAKKFLDLGFFISFAGNLTYKNAANLHDAASFIPLDRLLLETDAPFLTPVPFRGKSNRPDYVINTYNFIAELRNDNIEKIKTEIYNNFMNICSNYD
ncbi:MAG: TatD family hydrolase [Spirochaetes bacterium]|nr:TatD family hydrolase [Spirochaetota bacterium]